MDAIQYWQTVGIQEELENECIHKEKIMELKSIASAFINAKKAFSPALKTKTNPAYKSKYADLGACLEAVNDAFLDNGIAIYQETFEDLTGVTVETVLLHESGESIRCGKLHVPANKQDAQGYGSALSYARRYSLMAACGIAPEDDDGNAASKKPIVSTITPTTGVWDGIGDEEKQFLMDIAMEVIGNIESGDIAMAVDVLEEKKLDAEEKIALWTRFDSKQRSAMKREVESRKEQKAA